MLKNFFAIVAIARVLRGGHPVRQARPRRLPKKRGSGPKRGMSSSVFGPTMTFRMGDDDRTYIASCAFWSQFTYLKNIMRDAGDALGAGNLDVVLPADFHAWFSFVRGDASDGGDEVDYALSVRESCTNFGLLPDTRLDGRLCDLLRRAAHAFAATLMKWNVTLGDFVTLLATTERLRARCTAMFLDHAAADPRCRIQELMAES